MSRSGTIFNAVSSRIGNIHLIHLSDFWEWSCCQVTGKGHFNPTKVHQDVDKKMDHSHWTSQLGNWLGRLWFMIIDRYFEGGNSKIMGERACPGGFEWLHMLFHADLGSKTTLIFIKKPLLLNQWNSATLFFLLLLSLQAAFSPKQGGHLTFQWKTLKGWAYRCAGIAKRRHFEFLS